MTRLYDRLYGDLDIDGSSAAMYDGESRYKPVVFDVTNVADYYKAHSASYSNLTDFPNVAPPFGWYWMEWRQLPTELLPTNRVGIMVIATDGAGDPLPNDARWSIGIVVFVQGRGQRAQRLADWILLVDESGQIEVYCEDIGGPWINLILPTRPTRKAGTQLSDLDVAELEAIVAGDRKRGLDMLETAERELADAIAKRNALDDEAREKFAPYLRKLVVHPVLLAHSLMACNNVEYEDHEPPPRLSHKHERKKGEPLTTFRTLVIRPMGAARAHYDRIDIGDGATAFHIVRGHFKTYTADRPLFGKRIGTYWWSPTTRGDKDQGEIVKDYRVVPTT